ncbi:hypothetical protein SAMN05216175_11120 [Neptunomonas qingdaonensis]|uniref:Uncharacterized protein n=1 Tax=Neptunomonas qingdaonensis TaxID=1045558 RepID=A0A1I2TTZ7_9GAMM|nr:hypothetical protein SAMN05216175_11120 [Neptunomonas qingdaonensis]
MRTAFLFLTSTNGQGTSVCEVRPLYLTNTCNVGTQDIY